MNDINQHEFSSEWKMAMDAISIYFNGIDQIFPSTSSGYCILLHALKNDWSLTYLINEIRQDSDSAEFENPKLPFWWNEWTGLLETLETQFEISFPKLKEIAEIKNNEVHLTKTQFNPNLSIEKIAEAVSILSSGESLKEEFFLNQSIVTDKNQLPNPWSESLQDQTRYVLNQLPISSFLKDGHCILKSIHHEYGRISLDDAISYNYRIKDMDAEKVIYSFATLDELIEAGWVVD
ncbi:hypothetical protein [Leptospira ryugenii]|nr:hypothetical protein [Leptospira ryugenii]